MMNTIEAIEFIRLRNMTYPRTSSIQGKDALLEEAEYLASEFAELDFIEVRLALRNHIRKSSYPPSISDIRNEIVWAVNPSPEDAWIEVDKLIGAYGSRVPNERLKQLDRNVLATIKRVTIGQLGGMSITEAKAAFINVYKAQVLSSLGDHYVKRTTTQC